MKRSIFISTVLVATMAVLSGLFWHNTRVHATGIQVSVKDLSEHSITLIGPADPSFDGKLHAFLKGRTSPLIEALKPFSVLVRNAGNQALVAYNLKWELVKPDGTIASQDMAYANPRALMDGGGPGHEELETNKGLAIAANSTRLVSLAFSLEEGQADALSALGADRIIDPNTVALLNRMKSELAQFANITVSVDGAFFEDGRFVGPNTTRFFDNFKAEIDARHDVLEAIVAAKARKKTPGDIFRGIEALANAPNVSLAMNSTPTDHYNYHRMEYAKQILRMKTSMRADNALAEVLTHRRKQWIKLHRQ